LSRPSRHFLPGLFAALVLFSCLDKSATLQFAWPWLVLVQGLLAVPLVGLGWMLLRGDPRFALRLPRPILIGLAGLGAAVCASAALSPQPRFSMAAALPLLSGLAIVPLLAASRPRLGWAILLVLLPCGFALAAQVPQAISAI
jgi:hypothetical protein